MKTFKELSESPVGKVGRTKESEALDHISNNNLEVQFRKIVKELGGKTAARLLLNKMDVADKSKNKKPYTAYIAEGDNLSKGPVKFIIDLGIKLKNQDFNKHSTELEFYSNGDAKKANNELVKAKFTDLYNITLVGNNIELEEK